jgi:hypothetical protein
MPDREQNAKLLHALCNTDDPNEQDRLAKELDKQMMQGSKAITTVEEARALIAAVDAAEAAGVEFADEVMQEFGYVQDEGGGWELPIPVGILRQLVAEEYAKGK